MLSIYARALYDAGDRAGARRALLRANTEIRRCLGPDHTYLVFNHLQLARMAVDDGDEAAAVSSLDELLRITAKGTGRASTVALARFGALYMRADIDERQGHDDDARARLAEAITLGTAIHGDRERCTGTTVNAGFAGCDGQLLLINLDLAGFAVATGAGGAAVGTPASPPTCRRSPRRWRT